MYGFQLWEVWTNSNTFGRNISKMNLVNTNCPNCGANLEVDTERGYCFCEYCGSKILIDDDDNEIHIHADNADQAGYDF